jgi:hypothetical protein
MAIRGRRVRSEGRHDDVGAGDTGGFKNAPAAGVAEHDMVAEPLCRTKSHDVGFDRDKTAARRPPGLPPRGGRRVEAAASQRSNRLI